MEKPEHASQDRSDTPQTPASESAFATPLPIALQPAAHAIPPQVATDKPAKPTEDIHIIPRFEIRHRRFLRVGIGSLLVLLSIEWMLIATDRPDPLLLERGETYRRQFRVEVNSATWVEWLQLDGIGPSLAHRIVAYRRLNGPFQTINDVARVPGIGPVTLDRIRPWLTIRHDISPAQSQSSPSQPQPVAANSDE